MCSEWNQEFTESCTVPVYVPPVDTVAAKIVMRRTVERAHFTKKSSRFREKKLLCLKVAKKWVSCGRTPRGVSVRADAVPARPLPRLRPAGD